MVLLHLDPALADDPRGQRKDERPDRDVHEEDPLPAEVLRQHAAEQDADRGTATPERTPDAERLVPVRALLERRRDDRQRCRRDHGPAESLHRARRDQHTFAVRKAAHERGGGEEGDSDHEHASPSEEIRGTAPEEKEAAERQCVCRHDPLDVFAREVELRCDRRECDVDDRDVEDRHEERRADDCEDEPAPGIGCGDRQRNLLEFAQGAEQDGIVVTAADGDPDAVTIRTNGEAAKRQSIGDVERIGERDGDEVGL